MRREFEEVEARGLMRVVETDDRNSVERLSQRNSHEHAISTNKTSLITNFNSRIKHKE